MCARVWCSSPTCSASCRSGTSCASQWRTTSQSAIRVGWRWVRYPWPPKLPTTRWSMGTTVGWAWTGYTGLSHNKPTLDLADIKKIKISGLGVFHDRSNNVKFFHKNTNVVRRSALVRYREMSHFYFIYQITHSVKLTTVSISWNSSQYHTIIFVRVGYTLCKQSLQW